MDTHKSKEQEYKQNVTKSHQATESQAQDYHNTTSNRSTTLRKDPVKPDITCDKEQIGCDLIGSAGSHIDLL